eukprot:scaffold271566_cov49-Attheya_sp.AAC.1
MIVIEDSLVEEFDGGWVSGASTGEGLPCETVIIVGVVQENGRLRWVHTLFGRGIPRHHESRPKGKYLWLIRFNEIYRHGMAAIFSMDIHLLTHIP